MVPPSSLLFADFMPQRASAATIGSCLQRQQVCKAADLDQWLQCMPSGMQSSKAGGNGESIQPWQRLSVEGEAVALQINRLVTR